MASIIKVDTIQDQDGNNIISEAANTITIGASGDTITIPSGATLANSGIVTGFQSTGIDDNATSTAITIDSSERVGLNTTTPGAKLEIDSTGSYYNTANQMQQWSYNGTPGLSLYFDAYVSPYFDTDSASGWNPGATMVWKRQGSEKMRIDNSGRLGIGTSSPSHLLHLSSDTPVPLKLDRTTNADSYISYKNTTDEWTAGLDTSEGFVIANGALMANPRLTIDSSGNVGIGNSNPADFAGAGAQNLVVGSGSGAEGITIYSGTTADGVLGFADGSSGAEDYRGFLIYKHNDDAFQFGTTSSERMRLNSTGLGIGTANPTEKLEVNGNIKFGDSHFIGNGAGDNLEIISSTGENITYKSDGGFHTFSNNSGTEYMRINTSGNLLIGNTNNTTLSNLEINDSIGLQSNAFFSVELGKGDTTPGSSTSSITLSYEASWYAAHTMIEVQMFAYNSKYLDHMVGFYTQNSPTVMRNNNNGNSTVTTSFTSTGTYTSIVNHIITFTTNVGYPIVRYRITRGGGTGAGFITKPTITFAH